MDIVKRIKLTSIFLLFFILFAINANDIIAGDISETDQKIIDAGVKKATELGANPLPICVGKEGNRFIPKGFIFSISNGQMTLKEGDMLINAGKGSITAAGVPLNRGEYAIVKDGKAEKGEESLLPKK